MGNRQAVIFDMDGVLLDTERLALNCWRQVAGEMHLEGIWDVFVRCVGVNHAFTRAIFREAYGAEFPLDRFDSRARELFRDAFLAELPCKAGAREILEELKESGVLLALASSTALPTVREELDAVGLLPYFDCLVTGDMVAHSKPDPEIFLLAAARCGAEPGNTWVVEDSFNGIRAAHAAGMRPIMVPDLLEPDEEMKEKAAAILPDLFAVRDYLLDRI